VVTVHDLLAFLHRRSQQTPFQGKLRLEMARYALRNAARILAVSNSTKLDVQRVFGVGVGADGDQIEVAYNAIDERFLHGHASQSDRDLIAEHTAHPGDGLGRERDLGNQQNGTVTRCDDVTKYGASWTCPNRWLGFSASSAMN